MWPTRRCSPRPPGPDRPRRLGAHLLRRWLRLGPAAGAGRLDRPTERQARKTWTYSRSTTARSTATSTPWPRRSRRPRPSSSSTSTPRWTTVPTSAAPRNSGGGGTRTEYAAAYRHIVDRFRAKGVTNVVWAWTVSGWYATDPSKAWSLEQLWPGAGYVNIIMWDPYNHSASNWRSFSQIVAPFYNAIRGGVLDRVDSSAKRLPLGLGEYGCIADSRRPAWLRPSRARPGASRPWCRSATSTAVAGARWATTRPRFPASQRPARTAGSTPGRSVLSPPACAGGTPRVPPAQLVYRMPTVVDSCGDAEELPTATP